MAGVAKPKMLRKLGVGRRDAKVLARHYNETGNVKVAARRAVAEKQARAQAAKSLRVVPCR
jgi:hypothetical protein